MHEVDRPTDPHHETECMHGEYKSYIIHTFSYMHATCMSWWLACCGGRYRWSVSVVVVVGRTERKADDRLDLV